MARRVSALTQVLEYSDDVFRLLLSGPAKLDCVAGRVALVCRSLGPGGAERQVVNTLCGLARAGVTDLHLLGDDFDGRTDHSDFFRERARSSGAAERSIWSPLRGTPATSQLPREFRACRHLLPADLIADIAGLYSEFRTLRPSVVHAWLDYTNIRAGLAAVLAGVPRIVLSGRSMAPHRFPSNYLYFNPAYKALCDAPGVSLTNNSRAGADDYAAWLDVDAMKIAVIYNGLDGREKADLAPASAQYRQQLGIPPDAPVVGGMFRFTAEKRPRLWVEAAAEVAARRADVQFVLFGDGELRPQMQALARRLGLSARLRMPGVTHAPYAAMRAMDVLVLTSAFEGLPNVLLEAQACGVPVVATRAGGSPEAVDHGRTGWIVDQDDPSAIAERVVATLGDQSFCARARVSGPPFVSGRFGLERMIRETLQTYRLPAATA